MTHNALPTVKWERKDMGAYNARGLCVCVCARESHTQRCMFVWGQIPSLCQQRRIRLVGSVCTDWAGASLRYYTLQQSGKLPNKQMKSTERRFLVSSEMWLQQMQRWHRRLTQCDSLLCLHSRFHFDLSWRWREEAGDDTMHMITHKIMFVSSNSGVTM